MSLVIRLTLECIQEDFDSGSMDCVNTPHGEATVCSQAARPSHANNASG